MVAINPELVSMQMTNEAINLLKNNKQIKNIQGIYIQIQYPNKNYEIHLDRHLYE